MNVIVAQLGKGPWLLGDKFTAADVLWRTALTRMTGLGLVEAVLPIKSYVGRWNAPP
jgi:glutathione S-transferase